jgi:hypothetical protein
LVTALAGFQFVGHNIACKQKWMVAMKEIIEKVNAWPFLRQLPAREAGFSLSLDLAEDGVHITFLRIGMRRSCKLLRRLRQYDEGFSGTGDGWAVRLL